MLQRSVSHGSSSTQAPRRHTRPVVVQFVLVVGQVQTPPAHVPPAATSTATEPSQRLGGGSSHVMSSQGSTVMQAPSTQMPSESAQSTSVDVKLQVPPPQVPGAMKLRTDEPSQTGAGAGSHETPAQGSATHAPPTHACPTDPQSSRTSA